MKELRPGWTLYREQANRFFLFNLVVGLVFMVLTVLAIAPFAVGLVQVFRSTHAGERFDFALFFSLFIPLFALFFVIVLLAIAVDIVLRDFMLPHFALEDTSAGQAWAEVRTRIAAEKGSFFLYAVLRILLPIAASIALVMVMAIPMLIVFAILAAIFAGIHTTLTGGLAFAGIVLEAAHRTGRSRHRAIPRHLLWRSTQPLGAELCTRLLRRTLSAPGRRAVSTAASGALRRRRCAGCLREPFRSHQCQRKRHRRELGAEEYLRAERFVSRWSSLIRDAFLGVFREKYLRRWFPILICLAALASHLAGAQAKAPSSQPSVKVELPPPPKPLLPDAFAGWVTAEPPKIVIDAAQADAANAAALKEYDFFRAALATYKRDGETLTMRALQFNDTSGSYGAYTLYRENGWPREDIGTGAASNKNRVLFWKGNTVVDATFSHVGPMSAA